MPMSLWRRTRMISFRVSEREFEALKTKSEHHGARNISDFARLALCGATGGWATGAGTSLEPADPTVVQLTDEIRELRVHVRHVAELLETRPAVVSSPAPVNGRPTSTVSGAVSMAADMPARPAKPGPSLAS